jgi:hypothetical protein
MVAIAIKLKPSSKLSSVQKPVREAYIQNWLGVFALKAPEFIASTIATERPFTNRTGYAASKWSATVLPGNKIKITSLVSYTNWLNKGIHSHQMVYLLNSKRAIPIQTGSGVIFRRCTVQGLAMGKWRHPGRSATNFFEHGLKALAEYMRQTYKDLILESMDIK